MGKKIILEGNIGAGKSTLLNFLKKTRNDIKIVDSGFSLFHPNLDYNILEYNKKDPKNWTFLAQLTFMKILNKIQNKEHCSGISIFTRSIFSAHNVFNNTYRDLDLLTNIEYEYLTNVYNTLLDEETVPIDLLIFFKSTSKVLLQRPISNSFKENIEKYQFYYDRLLDILKQKDNIKQIFVIDGDKSLDELKDDHNEILNLLSD